jgi:acyl-CoA synthetase (AMP-forming)/AMP-acid ligase II
VFYILQNIFSFLQDSARRYPDKVFVVDKGNEFTYSEIYNKSLVLAGLMYEAGVKSGDRVLVYLDNSAEYIVSFFGVLLVNGIVVPINKNNNTICINHIIADTAPRLIITNSVFMKRLQGNVSFKDSNIININRLRESRPVCSPDLAGMLTGNSSLPALIIYTSSTTRLPKGVTLTHKNLTANTESIIQYLGLTEKDSLLAVINFSYSYGNSLLLTHTKAGSKIIIENRVLYPIIVIEQIYASKATGFSTVGSYIKTLLKQDALKDYHLKYLRYITFAGERTCFKDIAKLKEIAPHIKIFVMYGQTEASARLSYLEPDMVLIKEGSIGKGIPGVTLKVVTEDGMEAPSGVVGEIVAHGENIMIGYWNNEADTKSVIKNGWLYTGDLAVTDEDGYIYVKGRKDDIIKHLGHRISPVEIETAINSCEQVFDSAVIGIENNDGMQIKAFVVPNNSLAGIQDINAHIRMLLPAFKRPQIIEFVNDLPRTANGKIKRSELRQVEY